MSVGILSPLYTALANKFSPKCVCRREGELLVIGSTIEICGYGHYLITIRIKLLANSAQYCKTTQLLKDASLQAKGMFICLTRY